MGMTGRRWLESVMKFQLVVALALSLMGCSAEKTTVDPMVLVHNERAFAADVADVGMRDGFLAHIAADGVLFVPEAVNGKAHYEASRRRRGHLSWFPIYAEISSGGDMGWTTGPWEWRQDSMDSLPQASGHYNTIWVLQPDSTWKFVFDMGVAHSPHQAAPPPLAIRALDMPSIDGDLTLDQARAELVQVERTFASTSASQGLVTAYVSRMANDIRCYRQGEYPIVGVSDVTTALSQIDGIWTWDVNHADVSQSCDLGYTFGVSRLDRAGASIQYSYGRIWRRGDDGAWQLTVDIHIPLPQPSTPVEEETGS